MKTSHKLLLGAAIGLVIFAVATRDTPEEREARHLQRGNEYFAKGEFEKARVEYRNAAKLMPIDPQISYRWALVDEAQGKIRNAYANLLRAEQQDPHYAPALLRIAHYQLVVQQYEEVQKRLNTVLKDDPENPEAHALLAALKLRRKEYDDVLKEAEFALSKDPANITAYSVLTGLYLAKGDVNKAEEMVDAGIAKNPQDLSLRLLKVKMYEKPLNLEKINQTYEEIIKLQPGDVQLRTVLADIYIQAGKLDDSETTLRNAVHDLPDNWALKHRLVNFLSQYRNMEMAEKEIQSYMQAFPERNEFYFWLAELYIRHNQTEKAVALLEQIVDKGDFSDRQSLRARTSLARINFRKGNKELAQKLVAAVLAKSPSNPEALYVRASIATDEGRYQNAVSDLRMVIRENPRHKEALQLLSEVLLLQGYIDLATETLSQVVEYYPQDSAAQVRLAQMYNENKDPARAMKMLALTTKMDPGYSVAWESMARIAIGMDDMEVANKALDTLDGLKGQGMLVNFLKGQMAEASGDSANARAAYMGIIRADPSSGLAERAVYELVARHKTPEELAEIVSFLESLESSNAYISTIIGESYLKLGRPEEATAAFDKAIAAKPPLQDPYLNRAKLYRTAGDIEKTIALLNEARTANSADIRAELTLAEIYTQQEKYAQAIAFYEDVVNRYPDLEMPANNMAALIADHAYSDPAMLEKAAKAIERFGTGANPDFLDTLAWVYYRQNKPALAQPVMARAVAMAKSVTPEMHYHYGAILMQAGNNVKAKEELEKATATGAATSVSNKARELLKNL